MHETSANALAPQLREQFAKARQAFDRNNLDYAIALLENILRQVPSCYEAREILRATQVKRNEGKRGFLKKMLGTASSSSALAKAQIALHTDPQEALHLLEPILSNDPNSVLAHKILAQAAMACDFPKTAALSLEMAYRKDRDKDTALALSEALVAAGKPRRAECILKDLSNQIPNDPDILHALKNTTAKRTLGEGGYEKLGAEDASYRDILRNEKEAIGLEDENRSSQNEDSAKRLAAQYEQRIANNPNDFQSLRKLADLYRSTKQLDKAIVLFERIAASDTGGEAKLHSILAEIQLAQLDQQAEGLDPTSDTYEAEYQAIQKRKARFEFENCLALSKRFPTDMKVRLQLGELYFQQGKITEAIKEFQRAQSNLHLKPRAQRLLADCFCKRGMLDLAERTLRSAIEGKASFDDEKKELLYSLGIILEQSGKGDEAIEQFKLIYEVDIDFRDVSEKVDRYYAEG